MIESFVVVGGLRVFTRSGGPVDGVPIVLVHGAVISGRYMVPTAERLMADHRVLVPDLPGFGRSDDPPAPLHVPELADALARWMDAVGLRRAHLLGNSLGTQIITALAVRAPGRVASLVLVGPTVDRAARTRGRQLWRLLKDALRERWTLIPLHLRDLLRAGPRFALASFDIALEDRIEQRLPCVAAPVLIVCGDRDPLAPAGWCRELAATGRDVQLAVIEGPHALNYSRPDELARLVREFVGARSG